MTKSMKNQAVNSKENLKNNPGYDVNPKFSPNGQYVAWLSMARNGYESDRNRLCVYNLKLGKRHIQQSHSTLMSMISAGLQIQKLYISSAFGMVVRTYIRPILRAM